MIMEFLIFKWNFYIVNFIFKWLEYYKRREGKGVKNLCLRSFLWSRGSNKRIKFWINVFYLMGMVILKNGFEFMWNL